jgi:hypothetical protein
MEHSYRYWGENPSYNPTRFDIVGGAEPDYVCDFGSIEFEDETQPAVVIGGNGIGEHIVIKSASTAEERLIKLFGQFNPQLYMPVIKSKKKPLKSKRQKTQQTQRTEKPVKPKKQSKNKPKRQQNTKRRKTKKGGDDGDNEDNRNNDESDDNVRDCCPMRSEDSDEDSVEDSVEKSEQKSDQESSDNIKQFLIEGGECSESDSDNLAIDDETEAAASLIQASGGNSLPINENDLSNFLI